MAVAAHGQIVIWNNDINGENPNQYNPFTYGQTFDTNITVSGIGRGVGIEGSNADDRYNANRWNTTSFDNTAYFTWTIEANSGWEIDLSSLSYTGQASSSGPQQFELRSSVDGFTTSLGTISASGSTVTLASTSFQNLTTPTEFRLYAWGATVWNGTFSINSFDFKGSVSAIPEPSTYAAILGAVALGGLYYSRRRVQKVA